MSKLIEMAVQRLEQLRGGGVAPPEARVAPMVIPRKSTDHGTTGPSRADAGRTTARRVDLSTAAMAKALVHPPGERPSPQSDQFRLMKRPLIRNAASLREQGQSRSNLIMVTSSLAGEGKSFTAANLAMSIASEVDYRVLLVDADVARPALPSLLGFQAGEGLLDLLEGKATFPDVLLRTDIEKLTILPSGAPRARATELLASDAMRSLLDDMSSRYSDRLVIFDSPPLLLTTEASELATFMGQIVVVVQADRTPQADVERAINCIADHPVRMLVLNQVHAKMMQGPGYGYSYGHGH